MTLATPIQQGSPEWLEARRATIGSSDIAVIVGEAPYKSAYTLAAEKLGLIAEVIDDETRELMDLGKLMQPVLLELHRRTTGLATKEQHGWRQHRDLAWATASLDGTAPVRRVVEAKVSHGRRWRSGERVPGDVLAQVQWQLFVVGWDVADVVVLDHTETRVETVERDDALIADLRYFAEDFRGYLARGELPPLDASESTARTLRTRHPHDNGVWLQPDAELEELTAGLAEARRAKKDADDAERNVANALRAVIGDASGVAGLISLKQNRDSERINWPAVASAYRELIDRVFADADRGDIATIPFRLAEGYEPVTRETVDAIESAMTDRVEGARVLRLLSAKGAPE